MRLYPPLSSLKVPIYNKSLLIILCLFAVSLARSENIDMDILRLQQLDQFSTQISVLQQDNQIAQMKFKAQRERYERYKQQFADGQLISETELDLAQINLSLAQASLLRWSQALRDARYNMQHTRKIIAGWEEELLQTSADDLELEEKLAHTHVDTEKWQTLYQLQVSYVDVLKQATDIAEQVRQQQTDWLQFLQLEYQQQQQNERELKLQQLAENMQSQQLSWLDELSEYKKRWQQLSVTLSEGDGEYLALETQIFYLETKIKLSEISLRVIQLNEIISREIESSGQVPLNLYLQVENTKDLLNDVDAITASLQESISLIQQYLIILTDGLGQNIISAGQYQENESLLKELVSGYQEQVNIVASLQKQLSDRQLYLAQGIAEQSTKRQKLPLWDQQLWITLGSQILTLPAASLQYLQTLYELNKPYLTNLQAYQVSLLVIIVLAWLLVWFSGRYYTAIIIAAVEDTRKRVTGNLIFIIAQLVRRNLTALVLLGLGLTLVILSTSAFSSYALLFYLAAVWFMFRFVIGIARLSLVERISDASGEDVRLYYRLKWTFLLGAVITALTVVSYQLNIDFEVRNLFVRLFSLFLFIVSLVLLKGHNVVPNLLEPLIDKRRLYLKRAIHLLCILIPLTIMTSAGLGLIGYVPLARAISYYQLVFLLVVVIYIILRGIIVDLMGLAAELSIRYFKNGWLWSEAILKPIDKISRIVIFVLAWVALFKLYGWGAESAIVVQLKAIFNYSIITFTGANITLLSILEFLALIIIFVWAARWLKEFTYRWLFRNVRDPGARYSFSSFTQYAVVTLGVIITLRVLGIEFSSLAVILGGLAVGIGFGLRDFANNIISGLMLLIERPVREGDLVSISDFEGRVMHIGLRSMRLRSWDRMEVLVPNSELFNNIFLNWTHQDNIVRTVLPIKVQRAENMYRVQQLIIDVLTKIPQVLDEPAPEVFLQQLDEALIEFEVRYFIDVVKTSRFQVRSTVLFAIWQCFEEHNIKPPYPQQDIHLKSLPSS